jgi:hypothetical protein
MPPTSFSIFEGSLSRYFFGMKDHGHAMENDSAERYLELQHVEKEITAFSSVKPVAESLAFLWDTCP